MKLGPNRAEVEANGVIARQDGKVMMTKTCPWPTCGRTLFVKVSKRGKGAGSQYLEWNLKQHVAAHERREKMKLKQALAKRAETKPLTAWGTEA